MALTKFRITKLRIIRVALNRVVLPPRCFKRPGGEDRFNDGGIPRMSQALPQSPGSANALRKAGADGSASHGNHGWNGDATPLRSVPGSGDHRSNVSAGGSVQKHSLTKDEKALCKQIGPKLVNDGLYFVGIDVIGGKLVEVNVMSPGGITYINKVYKPKVKVEEKVIDFIESKVQDKLQAFDRRVKLRKTVEEA